MLKAFFQRHLLSEEGRSSSIRLDTLNSRVEGINLNQCISKIESPNR
jgi:hypothetical protein